MTCSSDLKLALRKTPSSLSPLTRSVWGKGSGIERNEGWGSEKQALLFNLTLSFILLRQTGGALLHVHIYAGILLYRIFKFLFFENPFNFYLDVQLIIVKIPLWCSGQCSYAGSLNFSNRRQTKVRQNLSKCGCIYIC